MFSQARIQRLERTAQTQRNIARESERISRERGISMDEAVTVVFKDKALLKKCHEES